jgi:hypothetical protein
MSRSATRVRAAAAVLAPALAVAIACGGEGAAGTSVESWPESRGAIVYVDAEGCIARVPGLGAAPFCPDSPHAVSGLTWLDEDRVAYITPELAQAGWRVYDYATGSDGVLLPGEGPRAVHAGPVQPYSVLGDVLATDMEGDVWVLRGMERTLVYEDADADDPALPGLITWSPDGEWALMQDGRDQALVIIRRDGSEAVRLAEASGGVVSWFMPGAGGAPHMDFTCGFPTPETYACAPELREPDSSIRGTLLLAWQACTGATGYEIVVRDAGGAVVFREVVPGVAYRLHGSSLAGATGELRWQVRSLIGLDRGTWSAEAVLPAETLAH